MMATLGVIPLVSLLKSYDSEFLPQGIAITSESDFDQLSPSKSYFTPRVAILYHYPYM